MAVADDIRQALYDAIEWQRSFAEACPSGSEERNEAFEQIRAYKKILKRRYGDGRSRQEIIDEELSKLNTVSIYDLQKMHRK